MEINNHKPISLDDLATMVADGFSETGERLDKVESRLEGVEGRLDKVESRLEGVEGRLDKVESRLEGVEGRLGKLEDKATALNSTVNRHLDLADERYLELKNRDRHLAGVLKAVADKTGVLFDQNQLEKF